MKLATDVYLPEKGNPPHPTILIRTAYGKGVGKALAVKLGPQGYAVVAQDLRGRFGSEGHHAIIFGNDGKSMLVTDDIRRASLRNGFERRDPLEPGAVYELVVDLWSTSPIFNRGHCIRVAVSSSNAPRFEPNANTGAPHPSPGKGRTATNTLHLSAEHPSRILLPLYRGQDEVVGHETER